MTCTSWSEEFVGPPGAGPDAEVWGFDLGAGGWGCGQLQDYTDRSDNARLDGHGRLEVVALREPAGASSGGRVTSARLTTKGRLHLRFGTVEARIKVPAARATWPAFWMLGADIDEVGWPACGEIDVMEQVGSDPVGVHGTAHGPGFAGLDGGIGRTERRGVDLSEDFHVYGVDWQPGRITWHLDGRAYSSLTPADTPQGSWPFTHDAYLVLNLAVGGAWPGLGQVTAGLPATMTVDWVRVRDSTVTLPGRG
ncbi:glycoside hydrolase family 16 protein [Kineosporia sp. R_H_3]|uniref:glycoside hydrolase family 16 protein n=1 Tax=Kineosporia sp. R_H_3 TaxID=1961848 RepID=UPI000B4ACE78|nr:glycoside hydrolase family 16 protein [Kineosporia sp. R_H_3]